MNVNQKNIAKYMNVSKNYEAYFEFFCSAIFDINLSKDMGKSVKFAFVVDKYFLRRLKNYGQI